ncbi:hypothetical protein [Paenibacillus pinistramenti]|uniref:hypothetical protein n=1 Tax=Paenibacillus pinistramenti TaxID=1768003 RepID=UPI00110A04C7|nr:hypothetical protein [Paenibacillus pinistramenti]
MLWTAVGICLFLTAWELAGRGLDIARQSDQLASSVYTNQSLTVYTGGSGAGIEQPNIIERYTGSQVIFMWRTSYRENIQIFLNGTALPSPGPDPDPEWEIPVSGIQPAAVYQAEYMYNDQHQITGIKLSGQ